MTTALRPKAQKKQASLLSRFRKAIVGLYIASILLSVPLVYFTTQQQVFAAAHKELSLLVDMVKSVREYVIKDLRPDLVEAGLYHSPGVSSVVTAGLVAGHFQKKQPDYYIKISSDNPLNPKNKPEPLEQKLIQHYRDNRDEESIVESGVIQGKSFLVSSRPSVAKPGCLQCHGRPAEAPEPVTLKYGTRQGYHYNVGEVVGVTSVGVPLQDVYQLVLKRSLIAMGILTFMFALIAIIISAIVKRSIIAPVVAITGLATALSKGDLQHTIKQEQNSVELSELAKAFERLRLSISAAMKRLTE